MKITEHDAITGESIEREPNEAEIAQAAIDAALAEQLEIEAAAKAAAKAALLEKLNITADEAKLLLA